MQGVFEFLFSAVRIVDDYCTAFARVPNVDGEWKDPGKPGHRSVPCPSADEDKMIGNIALGQVICGRDHNPRRGIVGSYRSVDFDQRVEIGEPGGTREIDMTRIGMPWAEIRRRPGNGQGDP